jgi:isopentenyl diphosphate isomerase/L-lactate dehydrogenase-like FMN-dependent dehydrogenase
MKIIVDCGIESGSDVYKAIALGADAAAVGRSMLPSLQENGIEGVKSFITKVTNELRFAMSCTGFPDAASIDDSCLVLE